MCVSRITSLFHKCRSILENVTWTTLAATIAMATLWKSSLARSELWAGGYRRIHRHRGLLHHQPIACGIISKFTVWHVLPTQTIFYGPNAAEDFDSVTRAHHILHASLLFSFHKRYGAHKPMDKAYKILMIHMVHMVIVHVKVWLIHVDFFRRAKNAPTDAARKRLKTPQTKPIIRENVSHWFE